MSNYYTHSPEGEEQLIFSEALKLKAYLDSAGIWTIGVGSTRYFDKPGAPRVQKGDVITEEYALFLMRYEISRMWAQMEQAIRVPLEQWQVDALISFAYNVGVGAFLRSTLLVKLNAGDFEGAEAEFPRWNKETVNGVKQVSKGLNNRRQVEVDMFGYAKYPQF